MAVQHRDRILRFGETALEALNRLRVSEISGTRTMALRP
jgi:hypothetical protein